MLSDRVRAFIGQHSLLRQTDKCLVALSGGADSVALLHVLRALGYQIEAAHCNFHLRKDEAQRDEQFCIDLCQRLGVPLHKTHFDTLSYAKAHKISVEMAARDLRYTYFEQLRAAQKADVIAVGHHLEDSVETVILNLVRGTGIDGLTGIAPRNGVIVRPLLCVSKQDILQYLAEMGQEYVTDSTNLQPDVARNKVRLNLIPLMKSINPSVENNIYQASLHLVQARKMACRAAESVCFRDGRLPIADLLAVPSPEFALWVALKGCGFTSAQTQDMAESLDKESGKKWLSPTHMVLKDRADLLLASLESMAKPMEIPIPEPGTYAFSATQKIKVSLEEKTPCFSISKAKNIAMLDASQVSFPLTLRTLRPADRFVPYGMRGSRLLSDFLTDLKKSVIQKRQQLVLTSATGEIAWVVSERTDNRCRVSASTRRVLVVSIAEG